MPNQKLNYYVVKFTDWCDRRCLYYCYTTSADKALEKAYNASFPVGMHIVESIEKLVTE